MEIGIFPQILTESSSFTDWISKKSMFLSKKPNMVLKSMETQRHIRSFLAQYPSCSELLMKKLTKNSAKRLFQKSHGKNRVSCYKITLKFQFPSTKDYERSARADVKAETADWRKFY